MGPHLQFLHMTKMSPQCELHMLKLFLWSIVLVSIVFKSATKAFRSFHYRINRCSTPPLHGRFLYTRPPNYTPILRSSRPSLKARWFMQRTCLNSSLVMKPSRSVSNNLKAMLATVSFTSFSDTLLGLRA